MIPKRTAAVAAIVVAALLVAASVAVVRNLSRVNHLERRLEDALGVVVRSREAADRVVDRVAELQRKLSRTSEGMVDAREYAYEMEACIKRIVAEPSAGEQVVSFGFVREMGDATFSFDPAELFTGEAANRIAVEEGAVDPGEAVPNDYYIRNVESTAVTKRWDGSALVVMNTFEPRGILSPRCVTPGAFRKMFRDPKPGQQIVRISPYWLVERDGVVVRLVEQYVP